MPKSKVIRDMDLFFQEYEGILSEKEVEAISLRRDLEDYKKFISYSVVFYSTLIILANMFGIPVYLTISFFTFLLLSECYAIWIKSAEVETEITYLEAGLRLKRN